jgi:hypothetical protein
MFYLHDPAHGLDKSCGCGKAGLDLPAEVIAVMRLLFQQLQDQLIGASEGCACRKEWLSKVKSCKPPVVA